MGTGEFMSKWVLLFTFKRGHRNILVKKKVMLFTLQDGYGKTSVEMHNAMDFSA